MYGVLIEFSKNLCRGGCNCPEYYCSIRLGRAWKSSFTSGLYKLRGKRVQIYVSLYTYKYTLSVSIFEWYVSKTYWISSQILLGEPIQAEWPFLGGPMTNSELAKKTYPHLRYSKFPNFHGSIFKNLNTHL